MKRERDEVSDKDDTADMTSALSSLVDSHNNNNTSATQHEGNAHRRAAGDKSKDADDDDKDKRDDRDGAERPGDLAQVSEAHDVVTLRDDSDEDSGHLQRSRSSSSSSSAASVRDAVSSDDDDDDIATRLLAHAKAMAQVLRPTTHNNNNNNNDSSNSNSNSNSGASSMLLRTAAQVRGGDGGGGGHDAHTAMRAALRRLTTELTKPVDDVATTTAASSSSMSTALTVVNAADETAAVMARVLAAKRPRAAAASEATKLRRLTYVDHSRIHYPPLRKDFYVAPPDVRALRADELKALMRELDGARALSGGRPYTPQPLRTWHGTGLPDAVLAVLARRAYAAPFAVQSVGTPALMSGRDLLVTAKTGSGKTLCYALALVRHCLGQPRCAVGDGPIGLVLVPTQELAAQVYELLHELCSAAQLRCVAAYGSTSLAENIRHVKLGCEAMVCTPGRLLDLLTVHHSGVMSLRRVSFVVVDEADRLFDSGFMEHVEAFLRNIRPDRQVAMISATMPRELKRVTLQHLHDPVEITVGTGRPTPASNVEQRFFFFDEAVYEVDAARRREDERFVRLMQILGDEAGDGQRLVLVFVEHKREVDWLLAKLSGLGYDRRVATLYAGMDPIDREFALEHFAPGKQFVLLATAVAERGLDMPYLDLVVNYTMPSHLEAYVHRVGRTGRAGRPGRAISFFTRGVDDDLAPELVDGLERAQQQVPEELYERAQQVRELRKEGLAHYNRGFYRGYMKGRTQRLVRRDEKAQLREAAKAAGLDEYLSASDDDDDADASGSDDDDDDENDSSRRRDKETPIVAVHKTSAAEAAAAKSGSSSSALTLYSTSRDYKDGTGALVRQTVAQVQQRMQDAERLARALAHAQKTTEAATAEHADEVRFQAEYAINDLPDVVRGRLQQASFLRTVAEETNTSIVRKGVYYDARYKHSHKLKDGERPLYLLIIGKTTADVRAARSRLDERKAEVMSQQRKSASVLGAVL